MRSFIDNAKKVGLLCIVCFKLDIKQVTSAVVVKTVEAVRDL